MSRKAQVSRRSLMKGALAAAASAGAFSIAGASAKGKVKALKVGLVGCGGRGKGALSSCVRAGKVVGVDAKVTATADYFKDRAERAGRLYDLPKDRCFGGADSYRKLIATDVDLVLLVTAPLFRPLHLEACIEAGKHVFIEKPVAVDPPGCRRVIAAGEAARKKGLVVVTGTEMRHQRPYVDTHQAVAVEGALGKLLAGRIAFNSRHFFRHEPIRPTKPEDLIASWQNWLSLSGDHLVEQHVHNIDIANWFAGRPPVAAAGFGGRARRPAGDMYDFFSIDYDYGDGVHIHSMCRQISGCWNWVGHDLVYQNGHTSGSDRATPKESPWPADLPVQRSGHLQEQVNTLYHVLKGRPLDQAKNVALSSATAVLGREATYSGKLLRWDDMMVSEKNAPALYNLTLKPTAEDFEKGSVEIPKEGVVPVPGTEARPRRT